MAHSAVRPTDKIEPPAAPAARRQAAQKRKRRDRMTVSVGVGYVEIEGSGELAGRGTVHRKDARCQAGRCGSRGEAHI